MSNFWLAVIRPLLVTFERPIVLEIGALFGSVTVKLLELAADRGGVVHVIDPEPRFDVDAAIQRFGNSMCLHRALSHDVLDEIETPDVALIDGDHNWHTVLGELRRLDAKSRESMRDFPLVMLHDVEWPYARRDQYHNPDAIPAQWRQQWKRAGVVWDQPALSDTEGINDAGAHAIEEGGPRNGVLTAVEDFIEESDRGLCFQAIPGFHGLGLLVTNDLLEARPSLRVQWNLFESAEFQASHARQLAAAAAQANAKATELARELRVARTGQPAMPVQIH